MQVRKLQYVSKGGLKNNEKTRKVFSHEKEFFGVFFIFNNLTPVLSVYKKNLAKIVH